MLFSINAQCQSDDNDVIFRKFFELRNRSHKALMNFRSIETNAKLPFYYELARLWYGIKTKNPDVYYNGIDISYRGIYADTAIQNRILQLLKNEFYKGELDSLVNEKMRYECKYYNYNDSAYQIKKEVIRKSIIDTPLFLRNDIPRWPLIYFDLIVACSYIDNKEIDAELIKMYNDSRFQEYKRSLRNCILKKNLEPYTTRCLKECKYDSRKSYEELESNVYCLATIESQESYRLLSEYILSDVRDSLLNSELEDVSYKNEFLFKEENDTIIEEIIDEELILTIDDNEYYTKGVADYWIYYYIYEEAYNQLYKIINPEFVMMLKSKNVENDEYRRKIYNWMQVNYGKYEFRSRW